MDLTVFQSVGVKLSPMKLLEIVSPNLEVLILLLFKDQEDRHGTLLLTNMRSSPPITLHPVWEKGLLNFYLNNKSSLKLLFVLAVSKALTAFWLRKKNELSPLDEFFHKVDDTAGFHDAKPIEPSHDVRSIYQGVNETCSATAISKINQQCSVKEEESKPLERKRRDFDIPFSSLGNGYTFNQEAYDEVN